ncbi:hypothetical protein ACFWMX_02930 [Streptomyces sp. NPDC058378]|uniref:hypothetical protein n=1 Tax=unclassified Streptomyces TaxID=2593676 RepID=UPI00365BDF55
MLEDADAFWKYWMCQAFGWSAMLWAYVTVIWAGLALFTLIVIVTVIRVRRRTAVATRPGIPDRSTGRRSHPADEGQQQEQRGTSG